MNLRVQKLETRKAITVLLAILLLFTVFLLGHTTTTFAAATSNSSIGSCGDSSNSFSVLLQSIPQNGRAFISLSNQTEQAAPVQLYYQSFSDSTCIPIGSATPSYGSWTNIGTFSLPQEGAGSLIVTGSGLGADPYQSVAKVLLLPAAGVCDPLQDCATTYNGYSGSLQPQILSKATDQIAVYQATPIDQVGYTKVSYYVDGKYVYGGTTIAPFNRNYLSGGTHKVTMQVELKNGETFVSTKTIDMGEDFTGLLFLKSQIYKSHNKTLIFILFGAFILIVLLILWIIRLIYKHRKFKSQHGLENYEAAPVNPEDTKSNIIVG